MTVSIPIGRVERSALRVSSTRPFRVCVMRCGMATTTGSRRRAGAAAALR
jgi:hypothetical protein